MHSEDLAKTFNEMHLKGLYKEILLILDSCEGFSMFEQITAPNILLVTSAENHESAMSSTTDGDLNTFERDNFSGAFEDYLSGAYSTNRGFKISDFAAAFPVEMILSHMSMKSTGRPLNQVTLREYIPHSKLEDVLLGKGIDLN